MMLSDRLFRFEMNCSRPRSISKHVPWPRFVRAERDMISWITLCNVLTVLHWMTTQRFLDDLPDMFCCSLFVMSSTEVCVNLLIVLPWMISQRFLNDLPELQLYLYVTSAVDLYTNVLTVRPWMISQRFLNDLAELQL